MALPATRITAAEREHALRDLSHHFGAGRLSAHEFDERSALALRADTRAHLAVLFTDLPGCVATPPEPAAGGYRRGVFAVAVVTLCLTLALMTGNWLWPSMFAVLCAPATLLLASAPRRAR